MSFDFAIDGRSRLLLAGLLMAALGCDSDGGHPTFRVSGAATFDGKPIPAGRIIFTPDAATGSKGAQGYADIRDGKYDTSLGGRGVVGGQHDVHVQGFDALAAPGVTPKPLFNDYSVKADLPRAESMQDFSVPASAAVGLVTSDQPPP